MESELVASRRLGSERKTRNRVRVEDRQALQRFQIHLRRVKFGLLIRSMRPGDKLAARATPDVVLKNLIRIVQIGNDNIELRKIMGPFLSQFPVTRKKTGQPPRFKR